MDSFHTLSSMKEGEKCRVKKIVIDGNMRKRLRDIGLVEGTEVECVKISISGDPVAYFVRGAVIALRYDDTSRIIVDIIK